MPIAPLPLPVMTTKNVQTLPWGGAGGELTLVESHLCYGNETSTELPYWVYNSSLYPKLWGSQVALVVKNLPANGGDTRDTGLIPGSGKSRGGHGNPLQYSCWRTLWTEKPGGLWSIASQRVRHDWSNWACMHPKLYSLSCPFWPQSFANWILINQS